MRAGMEWLVILGLAAVVCTAVRAQETDFDRLVDRYFEDYYQAHPTDATSAGFHEYDHRLEDYSQSAIRNWVAALKRYKSQFLALHELSREQALDRLLVVSKIDGQVLELETIRPWQKNPDVYSSGITAAAFVIMSRQFAPAPERLRALIARERAMPKALVAARANLKNPPRIYTQVAIEQLPGIIRFFQNDVPSAFRSVRDPALQRDFLRTNAAVIRALRQYQTLLRDDWLPRSNGDFRIGADNYRKKLMYDEMVDTPLDRLLEIGERDLRRNQDAFRNTAAKLDRRKTPELVLAMLEKDHPPAGDLLHSFRSVLGGLHDFIVNRNIVTIPSPVPPIVEETPPFMRALTFASMDTPGPYEHRATEAFFNVTLPEASWSRKQVEEHMAAFNRGVIVSTAIHEAYPGHYVQFLWMKRAPSKVRKLIGASSNAEGWAHYCEQMMLDEGYGHGDLRLRLGQLQDALLRNARFIAGIRMHTGQMSFDEAIDFFVKEGFQTRANAEREVKRGTSDPTYLVYTLGKLAILKLREDYRKAQGSSFSLLDFHDEFLKQGYPPIKLIRRELLDDTSPVL
jgi:hypothetical protein